MNKQDKFIKTSDKDTMQQLSDLGYKLLNYSNGYWTFINDVTIPMTFEHKNTIYTNMLTF